jgi:hypothetical protein
MKKSTLLIALLGFAKIMVAQNATIEAFLSTPFITNLTISSKSAQVNCGGCLMFENWLL